MAWKGRKKFGGKRKRGNYVAKVVNKILAKRLEDRYHDIYGFLDTGTLGSYTVQLINGLVQSTGDAGRIGNEVSMNYLMAKLNMEFPDTTNRTRVMIVLDKQPNGLVPNASDLWTYTGQPVDSFLNPDSKARFHVIKDVLISGGTSGGPATKAFNWKINLRKKSVLYKGTTDTIASIQTNALWLITASDSGVSPNPRLNYMFRLNYLDN